MFWYDVWFISNFLIGVTFFCKLKLHQNTFYYVLPVNVNLNTDKYLLALAYFDLTESVTTRTCTSRQSNEVLCQINYVELLSHVDLPQLIDHQITSEEIWIINHCISIYVDCFSYASSSNGISLNSFSFHSQAVHPKVHNKLIVHPRQTSCAVCLVIYCKK